MPFVMKKLFRKYLYRVSISIFFFLMSWDLFAQIDIPCAPFEQKFDQTKPYTSLRTKYFTRQVKTDSSFRLEVTLTGNKINSLGTLSLEFPSKDNLFLGTTKALPSLNGSRITYSFQLRIKKEAVVGDTWGKLRFDGSENQTLREDFCLPVGSDSEEFLQIRVLPTNILRLKWGEKREVALEFSNSYPYSYLINEIKTVTDPPETCCKIKIPNTEDYKVRKRNSDKKLEIQANGDWTSLLASLLAFSVSPVQAQYRIDYKDTHSREIDEKPFSIEIVVLPPRWLLFLSAAFGGAIGGFLRYFYRKNEEQGANSHPIFFHVLMGVVASFIAYSLFQLGDISLFINNLNLEMTNDTGGTALLLGLLGGWGGEAIFNKIARGQT